MREAPERIWIDPQDNGRWYREQAIVAPEGEVEYVRADLAAPQPPADVREALARLLKRSGLGRSSPPPSPS